MQCSFIGCFELCRFIQPVGQQWGSCRPSNISCKILDHTVTCTFMESYIYFSLYITANSEMWLILP